MTYRIVITGGPSTGKTSLINYIKSKGLECFEEISRDIIKSAQQKGINNIFMNSPIEFSQEIINLRVKQFKSAKTNLAFYDRGIPDVIAYQKFINAPTPKDFLEKSTRYKYTYIFILEPWREIFINDNERLETFNESEEIYTHLTKTYKDLNYNLKIVPKASVKERFNYIMTNIESLL